MAHADLVVRCSHCREELVIAREAAQRARPVKCPHCGTPAYVWQLLGRTQRAATELNGTWEGARA